MDHSTMEHPLQKYTCPMHPQIVQDKSGNCPICGMGLVLVKNEEKKDVASHQHGSNPSMGHEGHNHGAMIADFKKKVLCSIGFNNPHHAVINNDTAFY